MAGTLQSGPLFALAAAFLFGLSAPAAKVLVGLADPWLLAGLLYLSSGLGLAVPSFGWGRHREFHREAPIGRGDVPWLAAAILAGGVIGPVLLLFGLAGGSAAQATLLLNLEGVFTALLAWCGFGEAFAPRIAIGMAVIALGAMALTWDMSRGLALDWSAVLVTGACLAWALDNNLTRRVAARDPIQIAALKGLAAGVVNLLIALGLGAPMPGLAVGVGAAVVGLLGYGTSLVFFVLALRRLGAARTGAYFSTAPFIGAMASVSALGEAMTPRLLVAAGLMALGVWVLLTERHKHAHSHEALKHDHLHRHDLHHQPEHAEGVDLHHRHPH